MILDPQRRLLWLPGVVVWAIFEILSELVIYSSRHMERNPEVKSYRHLYGYTKKGFSAWTEVWSGAWPSTASIMAPGGRFGQNFEVLGGLLIYISRLGCRTNIKLIACSHAMDLYRLPMA